MPRFRILPVTIGVSISLLLPPLAHAAVVPAGGGSLAAIGLSQLAPQGAVRLGALAPSTRMRLELEFKPRDPVALSAFAQAVSTPGSPDFRHFLAKGAFAGAFGPAADTVRSAEGSLRSAGLSVGRLSRDGLLLPFSGSARQVGAAFRTTLARYRLASGRTAFGPVRAPRLGSGLDGRILTVLGLDDFSPPAVVSPARDGSADATSGCLPQSSAKAKTYPGYWTPKDLAQAYDFGPLYADDDTGQGESVSLLEINGGYSPADIAHYESCYSQSAVVPAAHSVDGAPVSCSGSSCNEEATLDLDVLLGMAPGLSAINVFITPVSGDNHTFVDGYAAIAEQDDPVVSTSVGVCEDPSLEQDEQPIFEQMAVQGQSVFGDAGDWGSEVAPTCAQSGHDPNEEDPSDQPTVTSVGGTSLTALGTPPAQVGSPPVQPPTETVWNDYISADYKHSAGGGGLSTQWAMPSYQGLYDTPGVINDDSSGAPCGQGASYFCREMPDVSASADGFYGYPVYFNSSWDLGKIHGHKRSVGGTSASTPLWAAITALAEAAPFCDDARFGPLNPDLYDIAASAGADVYLNDILPSGSLDNNDSSGAEGGLYPVTTGYDMATGLGSPVAGNLAQVLCQPSWGYSGDYTGGSSKSNDFGTAISSGLVGAPGTQSGKGAVYDTNTLPAQEITVPGGVANQEFGDSITGSASQFEAGAPGTASGGAVYSFTGSYNGQQYTYGTPQEITPPAGEKGDSFGLSVATDDGNYLVVGAPATESGTGEAYVYDLSLTTGQWSLLKKIAPPAGSSDLFGYSVAINDAGPSDDAIIGDPGTAAGTGSVYVYKIDGSKVTLSQTLTAPDGTQDGWFGSSVADVVFQPELAVAAAADSGSGPAVYPYALTTAKTPKWKLGQELNPTFFALAHPSAAAIRVAMFQYPEGCGAGNLVIGLPQYNGFGPPVEGTVFEYGPSGRTPFAKNATIVDPYQSGTAPGAVAGDDFGAAVSGSDGQLYVGTPDLNASGQAGTTGGVVDTFGREDVCP